MNTHPGYRGREYDSWQDAHHRENEALFKASDALAGEWWVRVAEAKNLPGNSLKHVALAGLLLRAGELFESLLLTARHGHATAPRILLRTLIDVLFTIGAACNDPEALKQWALRTNKDKLKAIEKLTRSAQFGTHPDVVDLGSGPREEFQRAVQAAGASAQRAEDLASCAGLHDLYITAYWLYSADVHASSLSLEREILADQQGRVTGLRAGPSPLGVYELAIGSLLLIDAWKRAASTLGLGVEWLDRYNSFFLATVTAQPDP